MKMKSTVHIEWEHGDADTNITEKYKFNSKEELDTFLCFMYELQKPYQTTNKFWAFQDGHYERENSYVDELQKKYNYKFEGYVPSDIHYTQYRPSVNSIHIRINNKKHYIVWVDLLEKPEHKISLPTIGTETTLDTGHICGYGKALGQKIIRENVIHQTLNESPEGEYPNTRYVNFKATLVDCEIDYHSVSEYNFSYNYFHYILLYKITDERLIGKIDNGYVVSKTVGFDPNFESKFNKNKYDGLSEYEIRTNIN